MIGFCIGLLLSSTIVFAQLPAGAGARDLYFGGFEDAVPQKKPETAVVAMPTQKKAVPPVVARQPAIGTIRNASNAGPLGLRYAIVQVDGARKKEVAVNTRFRAGDSIQIKVQSNSDGYLYIVSQGTSGKWQVIFPSKSQPSNRIKAGIDYVLPDNSSMRFAGQPGVEKLFVMLTRLPERDLDSVIYELKTVPGAQPMQISSNTIDDPLVSRLRTAHTRDLMLEEVSSPAYEEKAMYVVDLNKGPAARVVADIRLTHE